MIHNDEAKFDDPSVGMINVFWHSLMASGRWKLIPALIMFGLTQLASMQGWPILSCFILSAIGIIPIALLLSDATEEVSEHSGPTIGAIFTAAVGIFIVNFVNIDAKSNWLEGVLL